MKNYVYAMAISHKCPPPYDVEFHLQDGVMDFL